MSRLKHNWPSPKRPRILQPACLNLGNSVEVGKLGCCGSVTVNACKLHGRCVATREKLQQARAASNSLQGVAVCAECPDKLIEPLAPVRDLSGVQIVSVHFNPLGHHTLRENHRQWVESLGSLQGNLTSIEAVYTEPAIDNAAHLPAGTENILWQKEHMINHALTLSDSKYVAWIDADMVADWQAVLSDGVARLEAGAKAVQLFSWVRHTDASGKFTQMKLGAVEKLKASHKPHGCPGGAWIARREDLLACGGLFALNIIGGGDEAWFGGITGTPTTPASRRSICPHWMIDTADDWSVGALRVFQGKINRVPVILQHLWHGDMSNRGYGDRWHSVRELRREWIDNSGPLLKWSPDAPQSIRHAVAGYFESRREAG